MQRLWCALWLVLAAALSAVIPVWSEEAEIAELDAKAAAEVRTLIEKLGHESYAVREAASDKILTFGLPAMQLVEQGAKNPDREIRYRCERLRVTLREIDLQRRLDAFAADVEGEKDHALPAWNRFEELHGGSAESRQLFVEIFRAEPDVLKALQDDPKRAAEIISARGFHLQLLQQAQQQIALGSIAAMVFASAEEGVQLSDPTKQQVLSLCYQQSLRDAMTGGAKEPVVRSLLANYIVRTEGWVASQALNIAMQYDIKEGLEPARKLVKSKGAGQPHLLQMGLLAIAKMGGAEDVDDTQALLDDKTVLMNFNINNQRIECQVRDMALVTTLHLLAKDKEKVKGTALEKADLKAFGFERLEANTVQVYSPHTIGFASDEKRQAVFKKWEELKAKLKK